MSLPPRSSLQYCQTGAASLLLCCCKHVTQCLVLPVSRGAFRLRMKETAEAQQEQDVRCHDAKQTWLSTHALPGLLQERAPPAAQPPSSHTSLQPQGHGRGAGRCG